MRLLDFKSNLILKMQFDALSSVPGTYYVINFWGSLPCKNFPELRKFAQVICMSLRLRLWLGLPFVFTMFLLSLLRSPRAFLSRYSTNIIVCWKHAHAKMFNSTNQRKHDHPMLPIVNSYLFKLKYFFFSLLHLNKCWSMTLWMHDGFRA